MPTPRVAKQLATTGDEITDEVLDPQNQVKPSRSDPSDPEASLLDLKSSEAAAKMLKDWDDSWKDVQSLMETWKVNRARTCGYTGVQLVKRENKNEAYIPYGAKKSVAGLNKAARLKRRLRAVLFADPPVPECTPSGDDDDARDAAETATRVLQDQCSEGQLDYSLVSADAFDLAGDYGSSFLRFWVDETGGGYKPKQIEAAPEAVDPKDPFPINPQTGVKVSSDPILRYVTEDGQFTDDRTQAAKEWSPRIRREILTGRHVRFIPFNVRDLWEADGVMIGAAIALGTLKAMFPEVRKWSADRIANMVNARPQKFSELLPQARKNNANNDPTRDDTLVFVLTRFHVQSPKYPEGAYLIACGKNELLHKQTWFDEQNAQPLDIPLTQFKQFTEEENPYGFGCMETLGPGNELRAAMLGSMLEHFDRFNNRKIFVPMTSTIQPQQWQLPTGTPIPILPGGEPKYEEVPDFPEVVTKTLELSTMEMDDESGLQQVGQGLNPAGVKSGAHADAIGQWVQQGLSDLRENTERGLVRGWRVILQLLRAYFTDEQKLSFVGDDGGYKMLSWRNSDFGDTTNVRIQRGSFTQLNPMQKATMATQFAQLGLLSKEDLEHVTEGKIGGMFGLQDNPYRLRVRRQIGKWKQGPPDGWAPPEPIINPLDGSQVQPPDPVLSDIFDSRPSDALPYAAITRVYELGRAMQGTEFKRFPPAWGQGLMLAFNQAKQAANVLDAEMTQKLQQENQGLNQKLQQATAKLAEKPNISISTQAPPLDEQQKLQVFAQEGIQMSPSQAPAPQEMDPRAELASKEKIEAAKIEADLEKHRMDKEMDAKKHAVSTGAELEKAKLTAKSSEGKGEKQNTTIQLASPDDQKKILEKLQATVEKMAQPEPKSKRVIKISHERGKDGRIAGSKAVIEDGE